MKNPYTQNRAEESTYDIWKEFVIPPFLRNLDFGAQKKPARFVGGRGCGKTSLLRYLSFRTQFSKDRSSLSLEDFETIGLYYRADTQFLPTLAHGSISDRDWLSSFNHYLTLAIANELLECTALIIASRDRLPKEVQAIKEPVFSSLDGFDKNLPTGFEPLLREVQKRRQQFVTWTNNLDTVPRPLFLPLKDFLLALIASIAEAIPFLVNTTFNVFIDEYENFVDYQILQVNTLLKHSEHPLVFHVALKRNGMRQKKTLGNEYIQETSDYRTVDLEMALSKDFSLFCAELMFSRLLANGYKQDHSPVNRFDLQTHQRLDFRTTDPAYRKAVLSGAEKILPSVTTHQIAKSVLEDVSLKGQLNWIMERGLKEKPGQLKSADFIDSKFPEESLVNAALLHQKTKSPPEILDEFKALRSGNQSKYAEWVHHYLMGVIFLIYLPLNRPCPLYAGFEAFLHLSKYNLRYFLELCNLAVAKVPNRDLNERFSVPPESQAEAAREASAVFVGEVKGCGDLGGRLHSVTVVLGQIFRMAQERPSQSEPEKTHFTVVQGNITSQTNLNIDEAVKWSVLFEQRETKVKGTRLESTEYILHPIFSPFFGISYRKGRKQELTAAQADRLFTGTHSDLEALIKEFKKIFNPNGINAEPDLFERMMQ